MTAMCFLLLAMESFSSQPGVIRSRAGLRIAPIGQVLVCICHGGRGFRVARGAQQGIARVPSAMGLLSRLAYARAKEKDVPVRALLRRCRLTAEQLEDPRTRIPARAQIDFLNLAAEALGDELLGFNLAMDFDL